MGSGRNEKGFWIALRKRLGEVRRGEHDFVRVENSCGPGTPDLNYCIFLGGPDCSEGWIELKCISHWPRSEVVLIDHFTNEQKLWIQRRVNINGVVWVFLKVEAEDEYLLFDGATAVKILGICSQEEMRRRARLSFRGLTANNVQTLLCYL